MRRVRSAPRWRNSGGRIANRLATAAFVAILAAMALYSAIASQTGNAGVSVHQGGSAGQQPDNGETFTGNVTGVVDGDTFRISSAKARIRVWGLDAPERNRSGGSAATAALSNLIAGRSLSCRKRDIDRFGRIVGQCFLPDGRDLAAAMIANGTAREYCRYSGNHYRTC